MSSTLSAPQVNTNTFAEGIDQDQTAQNVQSDLLSIPSACLVKLLRLKSFWVCGLFSIADRGRLHECGAERVNFSCAVELKHPNI